MGVHERSGWNPLNGQRYGVESSQWCNDSTFDIRGYRVSYAKGSSLKKRTMII